MAITPEIRRQIAQVRRESPRLTEGMTDEDIVSQLLQAEESIPRPIGVLDCERSIWIEQEDLGKEVDINIEDKWYSVTMPQHIDKDVVIRLRGLGKTKDNKTGDVFLHIWINKGEDIRKNLWLSETDARNGTEKRLSLNEKKIMIVIPPKSHNGLTIRLRGLGKELGFNWRAPFLHRERGDALVKLFVYPDDITPRYGSFDMLSTENMILEGWVYRKFDDVIHKMGKPYFHRSPIYAETVADLYNEYGWRSIYDPLVCQLGLIGFNIELTISDSISLPGSCQRIAIDTNNYPVSYIYKININEQFLDNPFSIAAIMAHELCHVVYSERIDDKPKSVEYKNKTEKASLEEERTVDLLVFMYKIGEFQLRVARDKRLTLGYFNQEVFERIQVIVTRKLNSLS